ncbi:hypothetical protein EIK77_000611 [Talaromyces pinophilus]|jgi:hypothetical protein|uniref:Uncharacterized protein n=1 Tax=Talaromyces pinophilus TaxID=128442 RepID=A0A6V8H8N8_TALPI|nr:hypothetical protein EIK77_000611 [Talaromyces pinophilus]PCH02087.1 Hypothetical protein PENO1_039540 [Penicillium occitanis (nom. inval.)]PCH10167.1 hypothetical protein PENOC_004310 [Penicillium occitanis (nom. inval.)]GAM37457.1 hypothetical protein TCE0_024f07392 [Talaromyces pinophilus]
MIRQDVWHAEAEIFLFAVADGVNTKLFRGWSKPDNFKNVMNEVYNIATNAPEKLKADGRELADDRMTKLLASLQTHSDAWCYDQAIKIVEKFKKMLPGD